MLYVGLDLSRKRLDYHASLADGEVAAVGACPPDRDGLAHLVHGLSAEGSVLAAIESMSGARFVHDQLELAGWDVRIADARRVKGLAPLACKTIAHEISEALQAAGRVKGGVRESQSIAPVSFNRLLGRAIRSLDKTVGSNPGVPLSTCDGKTDYRPRGIDLLIPIRLANVSSEQSVLAGPATVVGKLVHAVRKPGHEYVDDASFATFSGPIDKIKTIAGFGTGDTELRDELNADAVVLAPGTVILPVAIYK